MTKVKLFILATCFCLAFGIAKASDKATVNYTLSPELQQAINNIITTSKTNAMDGLMQFSDFIVDKKFKKELKKKEALTLACREFLKAGLIQQAAEMGRLAYETDGGYFPAIMTYGDALYELKKYGDASALYEAAMVAEPEEKSAYLKGADVYKFVNADHSLEILQQFKTKFPNDPDVNKAMGSIYYYQNKIDDAIKAYDTYFAEFKGEDLEAQEEYAIILYIKKDFQGSLDKVNAILPKDPNSLSLNRLKFYNLMELMQVQGAKAAAEKFFSSFKDTLYNGTDYKYQGQLAEMLMDTAMMVNSFEHAAKLNPEKAEIQLGLSEAYEKIGEAEKAVTAYKKYLEIAEPDKKSANGVLKMGKIYYACAAAIEDSAKFDLRTKYVQAGDKIFSELETMAKDSYLGPMWRARIQTILDPTNPIESVKECYDKVYERLAGKDESYNTERKECLVYSAFYYFKKDDYDSAKDYCEKVLAIDPNHGLAKNILNAIAQLKK